MNYSKYKDIINSLNWPLLSYFSIISFAVIYMLKNFYYSYQMGDEGIALVDAWRIEQGQVPVKDYFSYIQPFSFLITALFFKMFGVNFFAARLLTLFYGVILMILVDQILKYFKSSLYIRSAAIAFLIPYGIFAWPMPSHHWLVGILQLTAVLSMLYGAGSTKAIFYYFFSGFLMSLACFTQQDQGGYLVILSLFLVFPFIDSKRRKNNFLYWAAGGVFCLFLFAIWLLPYVDLMEIINQWFIYPLKFYKSVKGNENRLFGGWEQIIAMLEHPDIWIDFKINSLLLEGLLTILPVLFAFIMFFAYKNKWVNRFEWGILLATGLTFWFSAAHRWSITYLIWAAPPSLIILMIALQKGCNNFSKNIQIMSKILIFLITLSSIGLTLRNLHIISGNKTSSFEGRAGKIYSIRHLEVKKIQTIINAIEKFVPEDKTLYCTGYLSLFNFITLRMIPIEHTYYEFTAIFKKDNFNNDLISSLEKLDESYVLLILPLDINNQFHRYLLSNYQLLWESPWNNGFQLYKRN
ncbi:MAG: hypothetical protein OEZ13_10415 [Spirochaetia bacterium]|nr:hypothetical protein [Spirochaetia bacterium]